MSASDCWIDIAAEGGRFQAYLATPPTGSGPGILLIQEIFGVNAHIQAVAAQYAMDGYTVLAPDVFWRQRPGVQLGYDGQDFARGIELMQGLDFPCALADLTAALAALRERPECKGPAAVMGYCMGGRLSFHVAAQTDVDAAVCYYGGGIPSVLDLAPQIRAPILFHFAEQDRFIPLEGVEAVRQAFGPRDNAMVEVYAGVDHGFNCWARGSYDQTAAALARGRTLAFLATNMPSS
ncbi:dienelactone hydrolase family protein [Panacagrimonas sp.]|uniref:dienelactone hydrolase family protein n=1 Tax=Panacagrimonas sp. TaxID=2480088 RepID=UPI003B524ACD